MHERRHVSKRRLPVQKRILGQLLLNKRGRIGQYKLHQVPQVFPLFHYNDTRNSRPNVRWLPPIPGRRQNYLEYERTIEGRSGSR